jgi:hypothetical protein
MAVGTGFIIAGVVAAGLAVGQATGIIDLDPDQTPAAQTEQVQPAKPAEPVTQAKPAEPVAPAKAAEPPAAQPAPAAAAPVAAPMPAPQPAAAPPAAAAAPQPAQSEPAQSEPAKSEPAAQPAAVPGQACTPDVNLRGGFAIDMQIDADGKCAKTGRIHPLMAIECTDGHPAGWFHRYYLDDKRSPVFVTACLPPEAGK